MKHSLKIIALAFWLLLWLGVSNAWYDLYIDHIDYSNWSAARSKWETPKIDITVWNNWPDIARNTSNIPAWFISCYYGTLPIQNRLIGQTPALSEFIINANTTEIISMKLTNLLTATSRSQDDILCMIWWQNYVSHFASTESNASNNNFSWKFSVASGWRFDTSLSESVVSIRNHLDAAEPTSTEWWWVTIRNFILKLISNILVPIIVIAWIIMWIIGAYSMLTSSDPAKIKKWTSMLLFGVLWVIVILSAKYLWNTIYDLFNGWETSGLDWIDLAQSLYEKIAYPFIKMAIYLSLWILFVVLAAKSISLVTSGDVKKAWTIIAWTSIWMLVIIWAKQIVEAVYWKQADVLNSNITNLWQMWWWILADKNIPILYNIINWVLGITATAILVIILVQTFQILINPSKAENRTKLWKSILYIFIWLVIIWAGYLITNLLIIN